MSPSHSRTDGDHLGSIPPFEPITDLAEYAFVLAQKGFDDSAGPVMWVAERANPFMVAAALRFLAGEIERDAEGRYPDIDRSRADQYAPPVLRGRRPRP